MPAVSILIPTYNGAQHIGHTIESVLRQTYTDYEIVVVDDSSTDGTAAIVATFDDARIRLERNPSNLGPEGNWNRALSLAAGRYVKLLPQDDLLHIDSLARQVEILDKDHDQTLALVFGARTIIGPGGRAIATRGLNGSKSGRISASSLKTQCVRRGTNVVGEPGAVMFRRDLAQRIGPFDGQQGYVIDLDYWLRLLAYGDGWYISQPVSSFRVSKGSWSVAIGDKQSRQYTQFISRMHAAGLISATSFDLGLGQLNARKNNLLRLVFYRLFVR